MRARSNGCRGSRRGHKLRRAERAGSTAARNKGASRPLPLDSGRGHILRETAHPQAEACSCLEFPLSAQPSCAAAGSGACSTGACPGRTGAHRDSRGHTAGRTRWQQRNVDIIVNGSRINAVDQKAAVAPTYDLSRFTVMPGGIDTHVHINWHFDPDGKTHHLRARRRRASRRCATRWTTRASRCARASRPCRAWAPRSTSRVRDQIAAASGRGPACITSLRQIQRTGRPTRSATSVRTLRKQTART